MDDDYLGNTFEMNPSPMQQGFGLDRYPESKEQLGESLLRVKYRICETFVPVEVEEKDHLGNVVAKRIEHQIVKIPYPELSLDDKTKSNLDQKQIAYLIRLEDYYGKILEVASRYKVDMRTWARRVATLYFSFINLNKSKAMTLATLAKTDYQISDQTLKRLLTPDQMMRPIEPKRDMFKFLRPKFKEPRDI